MSTEIHTSTGVTLPGPEVRGSTILLMNMLEEQALVDDLRRRGDHTVQAAFLSCPVERYRSAARKVGRRNGWRIRTFLINGGSGVVVVWADRESTELEQRAVVVAVSTGRNYDEVLEEVRRNNLRPVQDA